MVNAGVPRRTPSGIPPGLMVGVALITIQVDTPGSRKIYSWVVQSTPRPASRSRGVGFFAGWAVSLTVEEAHDAHHADVTGRPDQDDQQLVGRAGQPHQRSQAGR